MKKLLADAKEVSMLAREALENLLDDGIKKPNDKRAIAVDMKSKQDPSKGYTKNTGIY